MTYSAKDIPADRLREIMAHVCPYTYTDVPHPQSQEILTRIVQDGLVPCDEGSSLHCWSKDYVIDGNKYQILGAIDDLDDEVSVTLVTPSGW